jgi:hypothetical protein
METLDLISWAQTDVLDLIVWGQQGRGGRPPFGPQPAPAPGAGAAAGVFIFMCGMWLFVILLNVVIIAGVWKAFAKAGEPGWASLIPVYNMMIMSKIAGRGETYGLLCLIPCAGIIFAIIILVDFCKQFDVGGGFVAGLLLLPIVFWPILGFGSARYIGSGSGVRSRRRRDYEEEDEEEEDRPRRRRRRDDDDDDDRGDDRIRRPRRRDDY